MRVDARRRRGGNAGEIITGVGIDVEPVARFRGPGLGGSPAFRRRVLTQREQRRCRGDAAGAAVCFTAKEAVAKALGVGLGLGRGPGVPCRDIEVAFARGSRAVVRLRGAAAALARARRWRSGLVLWQTDAQLVWSVAAGAADACATRRLRQRLAAALRDAMRRHAVRPQSP